ncbi:MAG: toll/interleukin-1 receptor domain-containing protein, partial [Atopobiaceae bacterium]|nr:toll/interleukin-1 receptor domain-containing protein [Atopobiaceae bacterium]
MRYDVFISYKNDGSGEIFAEKLAKDLKEMGYSVYFNSHERRSGPFDERIRQAVAECKDFIAVVSKGYLGQLLHPDTTREDWIREELLEARGNAAATITPVYLKGVAVPTLASFAGSNDLSFFPTLDGVEMPGEGYDVSPLDSLTSRLVSRKEGELDYRDTANGNPSLQAKDLLMKSYDDADQGDYRAM